MIGWITLVLRWRQDRNTSVLLLSAFCSNFKGKKSECLVWMWEEAVDARAECPE